MISKFDELENLYSSKIDAISFEKYFNEMDLMDEQKEERIDFAISLFVIFATVFELAKSYKIGDEEINEQFLIDYATMRYNDRVDEVFTDNTNHIKTYVGLIVADIIATTIEKVDKTYFTSEERAIAISENESNTIYNYIDLQKAIKQGKTRKKWITMKDKRVRHTHLEVDDTLIGIKEQFTVGGYKCYCPKDTTLPPKEIIHCRCVLKYY